LSGPRLGAPALVGLRWARTGSEGGIGWGRGWARPLGRSVMGKKPAAKGELGGAEVGRARWGRSVEE